MLLNNVESDLKTRLEEEGITQKELAGQIGVSLPYVNRITRGREQLVNKVKLRHSSGRPSRSDFVQSGFVEIWLIGEL